jgi:DMSO/TMAO reductase YedYZ molybdopterin-dependent catalytic subunit
MDIKKRIMTESPLNAEPPTEALRSWITPIRAFFNRNQGAIPEHPISLQDWRLTITGEVKRELVLTYEDLLQLPKANIANTLECSGNGRSLLKEKAPGNPWTIGGVANVFWGGVLLRGLLEEAGLTGRSLHVAFEGFGRPVGGSGVEFIRSIPIDKAIDSTLLAYEMNGEPLPNEHGFPLRALPLGWYGANSVKWLNKIVIMPHPYEGYFMDKAYRVFQKGQDPKTGEVVTEIRVKSIITKPLQGEALKMGKILILGMAYAGPRAIKAVEVSFDGGLSWSEAQLFGPSLKYAWQQWQYLWHATNSGEHTILSRATDESDSKQPMEGQWNAHGYCNNGVLDHGVRVSVG